MCVCSKRTEGANCIVDDDGCSPLTPWEHRGTRLMYIRSRTGPQQHQPDNYCSERTECPINNLQYSPARFLATIYHAAAVVVVDGN